MDEDHLLETWRIHTRINLYLLMAIREDAFSAPAPAKGRSFVEMFAHIHNVRLMWLHASSSEHPDELQKIVRGDPLDKTMLHDALAASASAIEKLLADSLAAGGKVKGFKPHLTAFLGYLIAHESYHHGEIGISLASIGFPLDKKTAYGMWEWGVR
jgi:uncharacterized damage-inducible protein DinB